MCTRRMRAHSWWRPLVTPIPSARTLRECVAIVYTAAAKHAEITAINLLVNKLRVQSQLCCKIFGAHHSTNHSQHACACSISDHHRQAKRQQLIHICIQHIKCVSHTSVVASSSCDFTCNDANQWQQSGGVVRCFLRCAPCASMFLRFNRIIRYRRRCCRRRPRQRCEKFMRIHFDTTPHTPP